MAAAAAPRLRRPLGSYGRDCREDLKSAAMRCACRSELFARMFRLRARVRWTMSGADPLMALLREQASQFEGNSGPDEEIRNKVAT